MATTFKTTTTFVDFCHTCFVYLSLLLSNALGKKSWQYLGILFLKCIGIPFHNHYVIFMPPKILIPKTYCLIKISPVFLEMSWRWVLEVTSWVVLKNVPRSVFVFLLCLTCSSGHCVSCKPHGRSQRLDYI